MKTFTRTLCALSILLLSSLTIYSQDATDSVQKKFLKESTPLIRLEAESVSAVIKREEKREFFRSYGPSFKVSMGFCAGSAATDILTQKHAEGKGYVEGNPLARGKDGKLNIWKAIALKGGACGLTILGERKHPKAMFWLRNTIAAVWTGGAIWNGSR